MVEDRKIQRPSAVGRRQEPPRVGLAQGASRSANRVRVEPDLSAPGHANVFVIGDAATIDAWQGKPVPGIALAASNRANTSPGLSKRLRGTATRNHFATGTRSRDHWKRSAVIDFGWFMLVAGQPGGFGTATSISDRRPHRLAAALNWLWIYATVIAARLITQDQQERRLA